MKLDINALLSGKVRSLPFAYEIDCGGEDDMPRPPAEVTFTSPIRVKGNISDSGSCLYLTLEADADYTALCDRCGGKAEGVVSCRLERMVAEEGIVADENSDDYFIAVEGKLDLDAEVAEELMLAFPPQILCREDCRGVCPICGQNKNEGDCDCEEKEAERTDPRWDAIARLLEEIPDEDGHGEN